MYSVLNYTLCGLHYLIYGYISNVLLLSHVINVWNFLLVFNLIIREKKLIKAYMAAIPEFMAMHNGRTMQSFSMLLLYINEGGLFGKFDGSYI